MTAAESPKPFRHALVLGKFMPLHAGHEYLITQTAVRADRVTVLVCTLLREPIPGALRYRWAAETLARLPNVRVVHVADEVPAQPEDSPDFWAIWVPLIHRYCGNDLDVVFTSEAYGAELGRRLQIPDICLDPARTAVPISATQIRQSPVKQWDFIPKAAQPYFVQRIALLGAESSGKTTLAAQLAAHFETRWVPEFVRDYLEDGPNIDYSPADLHAIGAGQRALERAYLPLANRRLFCDTDALTTATWAELYFGPEGVPAGLTRFALADRYALTLLLAPDLPWVPDGTRDRPDPAQREQHFALLRAWLLRAGRPFTLISGDYSTRLRTAIDAVEAVASGVPDPL
jgi:HTH-type transcriptional regulator, transcriptional repressor of NAD biosynthesis genes